MPEKIKITALGGSAETLSSTFAYLKFTAGEIRKLGDEVKIIDIKDLNLPLYGYLTDSITPEKEVTEYIEIIHNSDGYVFASPEYHGTVSAAFKNAVDYFEYLSGYNPPYLGKKPAGLIAAAGSENSGYHTLSTMMSIVQSLRGISAPSSIAIGSAKKLINASGEITSHALKRKLIRLAREVYELAGKLK